MPETHSPTADSATAFTAAHTRHLDALTFGYRQLLTMRHTLTPADEVTALVGSLHESEAAASAHGASPGEIAAAIRRGDHTPIGSLTIDGAAIPILSLAEQAARRVETTAQQPTALRRQTKDAALHTLTQLYHDHDLAPPGQRRDYCSAIAGQRGRALEHGATREEVRAAVAAGIAVETPTGPTTAGSAGAVPEHALTAAMAGVGAGAHRTEAPSIPAAEIGAEPVAPDIGM